MISPDFAITAYSLFVAGIVGLIMGSFVNCWAWRFMRGESVARGRSHCTSCGHELGVRDLVPVASWVASRGKCRYCGAKVSARYPATEVVCAVVFMGIVARYGIGLETLELLVFACTLLFLSLTDLDDCLIPNGCILVALVTRAVYLGVSFALGTLDANAVLFYVGSGIGVGLVMLVLVAIGDRVFGRESMGGGDLKLYAVAGFYFGWPKAILVVILSCVIGIVVAVATAGSGETDSERSIDGEPDGEPKSVMKRSFPFGPSIAAACVIVMLVGDAVLSWYLSLL